MAYATVDDLAEALRIKVTPDNTAVLSDCLDSAADEIDTELDRIDPLPVPPPAAVSRCNVNRAVEWVKAPDAAFGAIGYSEIGVLRTPKDPFARHAATISQYKQQYGVS